MKPGFFKSLTARQRLTVFLGLVVSLAGSQVWLTVRMMQQDRNLEAQRSRERLEQTADLAVAQLAGSLGEWDLGLHDLNSLPPSPALLARLPVGATLIVISHDSVTTYPKRPLLFVTNPPAGQALVPGVFDAADQLELREQDYQRAITALQPLVSAPQTRAEALLRIARIEQKAGHSQAALDIYQRLTRERGLDPSGTPYALLAATARIRIVAELGRRQLATQETKSLRETLLEGRWPLSREAFQYNWSEPERLGILSGDPPAPAVQLAALVSDLNDRWQGTQTPGSSTSGKQPLPDSSLLVWNANPDRLSALLALPNWLNSTLKLPVNSGDVHWRLLAPGVVGASNSTVTRSLADAQLPGRMEFSSSGPNSGLVSSRRILLLGGAALMLTVILVSSYVVQRGIGHELRVAQLQSDFVASVSHEFRSPLTTLRTITELLAQNRITDEARRQQSYVFLHHETNRLHRLVEDLLDFGRMESGRKQYRMETYDAFQLVRSTVDDFKEMAAENGFQVQAELGSASAVIHADEEAFRRALRNLLENAMKYSPVCRTVWVDGKVDDSRVLISVRDQGMGIAASERRAVFQKFVRSDAAKKAGIKGTGIGLAMVQQISAAMGGEVRLQSEVGVGSTFTLVLPLARD